MIPPFDAESGNLPSGIHKCTWDEFLVRFGYNTRRLLLITGLKAALEALRDAGCRRVYVDGSFVTRKEFPGDFDACWEAAGVDIDVLLKAEPVILSFENFRAAQKARFGGELFVADWEADDMGTVFLDFFQRDKVTRSPKGIIALDPGDLQ
jgi:hypothetical protein